MTGAIDAGEGRARASRSAFPRGRSPSHETWRWTRGRLEGGPGEAAQLVSSPRERGDQHPANERTSAAAKHNISIPRDELVARIARARVDPRFKQLVAVMFRNRRTDDATDEELRAFDETEALADEQH